MAIVSAVGTCALPGGRSVTNATNPGCEKCKCDDIINIEMANTNLIDLTSTDATRDKCKNNNQCRGGGGEFYTAGGRGAYARGGGRGGW